MKTLINIFGAGHSGTTMLDLMLGNDKNSFSLGEVNAWFRPYRKHHFRIICSCGEEFCPYWDKIKFFSENEFHRKTFDILNVDYLIDSSKNLNWGIDNNIKLKDYNIEIFNILLYKNPINYIYSNWKRGVKIEIAIYKYTNYYSRFLKTNMPYVAIKYDELTQNTDDILNDLCLLTGQEFMEDKKLFWQKQHHHLFGSISTRRQMESKNSTIISKQEYPEEFEKMIIKIQILLERNIKLQKVCTELENNDIKKRNYTHNKKIHKPIWYYFQFLKSKYTKSFPSDWDWVQ